MKLILFPFLILVFLSACTNENKIDELEDNKVSLRTDTINVVHLSDTLVINESTCRGCAYEQSTHFDVTDSMGLVKLFAVHTTDNNSPDMAGGSISKDLVLVSVKTGKTIIKLYKFWKEEATAKDSLNFIPFNIEVRN